MSPFHNAHFFNEDRTIEHDIRAEVALCRDTADQHLLGITVESGVVHLTGSTETYSQKWAIERAASRVIGVKEVRDYLDVRPREDDDRDDVQIERAAEVVLRWDARVPSGVRAHVVDGVLRLDGVAERFTDREAAEEAVRNLLGIRDVVNNIRLAPIEVSSDLQVDVEAVIRRRFGFGGRFLAISVESGIVLLRGLVPTFAILDEVERAVRSIPGVKRIDNQLLVGVEEDAS